MDGHFGTIARLLILTGMRRNECASLRSDFIDLDNKMICLPASLTKNKREHKFPIGNLTVSILAPLPNPPGLLFPARGNAATPFHGWSQGKTVLDRLSRVTAWTLHDLRRTYAINLAKLGVPNNITERLLNQ
jgi:integrase